MRYIYYLIISTLIFIFQTTLCQYISIADIKPNIMLIFIVSLSFLKGNSEGLILGIIMGLLQDCYFGPVIGCNLFLYAFIGYVAGCLADHFNKENIFALLFFIIGATLIYNLGFYLFNIVLRGYTSFNYYIILNILPELIYNSILGIIIYFVIHNIKLSSFSLKRKKHY